MRWILPVLGGLGLAAACGDNLTPLPPPGPSAIQSIDIAPLALSPAFSPSIHDYTVRCAEGTNAVSLTVTDATTADTQSLELAEGQLIDVRGQYFIRCLPHDFPAITTTAHPDVGQATPGWYLVNSKSYAIVLDGNGTPVWYRHSTSMVDVSSVAPNTLSYMRDPDKGGYNYSLTPAFEVYSLGASRVTTLRAVGTPTDEHELQRLPNGDYLLLSYVLRPHVDLTGLATFGADATIADCRLQVVSPDGLLVWSWLGTNHVDPVTESLEPQVNMVNGVPVVDPFHCNSVDLDAAGNFLLSMRHANTVLYIDRATKKVQWKMGGTPTNKDGAAYLAVEGDPETAFYKQHDVRWDDAGHITMFDNHGAGPDGVARGVRYALDIPGGRATFVSQLLGVAQSGYEGSYRRYDDGDQVISWGATANETRVVTEYDASGQVVLEMSMPGEVSYRAVKVPPSQLDIHLLRATAGT